MPQKHQVESTQIVHQSEVELLHSDVTSGYLTTALIKPTRFYNRFPVPFIFKCILFSPVLFYYLYQPPSYQVFQFNPTRASVGDSGINTGRRAGRHWGLPTRTTQPQKRRTEKTT